MSRKLTFLAYLFACTCSWAQEYPFVYYTPRDGLVNSRVRRIKQDTQGRMLFITYGGLSIYDGTRFVNYGKTEGLASEIVNDVMEAGPDSFLVATNTSSLNTLIHGKIGTFPTSDGFCPVINRFLKSHDGQLYALADDGLYVLSKKQFIHLPFLNAAGQDIGNYFDRIFEWKNFFLISPWNFQLREKLILYDRQTHRVLDVCTKFNVLDFLQGPNNRIWTTTSEGIMLVDTAELEKGKIIFDPLPERYKSLGEQNSYALFDRENNLWVYGRNRIARISSQFQKEIFTTEQGLRTASLTDLYIDREGIAWFATDGNGIIKIRSDIIELLNGFGSRHPVSAATNQNDTVWAFSNNVIYRVSKNGWKSFELGGEKMNASVLYIYDKRLYLADANKLVCVDNKDLPSAYHNASILVENKSHEVSLGAGLVDQNGTVIQYNDRHDSLFSLFVLKGKKMIAKYSLSYMMDQMITDKAGRLWLATRDNHLMVFTTHPGQTSGYLQLLKDYSKELPTMSPRCLVMDTSGALWIGTRYNGVYRFQFRDTQLVSYTQFASQNGLTDDFVYSINCDGNNTIWVGTQTGLDKIFLKDSQYIIGNISKSNNLFQSIHKIIITKNNTVWALTAEGTFFRINPSPMKNPLPPPQFFFTSIQINNQPYSGSSSDFPYWQNNLSFNVAAPSFLDERSIRYSYLLEGSGINGWSRPSNTPVFNFINLSAGHYTLKVRSDFPEAIYPSEMIRFTFSIRPPWWQTWWLRTIAALLLSGLFVSAIRGYYRRKLEKQKVFLEKQQAIEKERTRIATDMHDDLGAGLSRIKFLSETIGIKKQKQLPFEDDISKIREYSHEMIDKMGEIVWALNEKNDSLSDLLSYTRSYTVEYLSQSGVKCVIDWPEPMPTGFVSGEFRRNIFLSVKEILHNIVKHSQANEATIKIQVNRRLCINIRDDGIGFDRSRVRRYSNGLANIEKRMKDIGGSVEIQHSGGTSVVLTVPLPEFAA